MSNPYESCPVIDTPSFTLRLLVVSDTDALLSCYSDEKAVAFMNDDNCDNGFYFDTPEKMLAQVKFWLDSYERGWFIRLTIIDKAAGTPVGTIEAFVAEAGILRLDIASEYEKKAPLTELFSAMVDFFKEQFNCLDIVTKAIPSAVERTAALSECGFKSIGCFREYEHYWRT